MTNIAIAYPAFKFNFEENFGQKIKLLQEGDNVNDYDLIVFSGGEDISPEIYGEKDRYCYLTNQDRDKIELFWLEKCIQSSSKILGVCRGHQLINAFLGGKLIQDLVLDKNRDYKYEHMGYHELIFTTQKSIIGQFFWDGVNSLHHQGVIIPGNNLTVTSLHKDIIESTENKNIVTVQWHPEFMYANEFFTYLKEEWING